MGRTNNRAVEIEEELIRPASYADIVEMFSRLSEVGRLSAFLPDGRPDGRLVQLLTESDGVVSLVYDEGRGPLAIGFGLVYPRLEMASAKLDVGFAAMPIGWRKVLAVARAMLTRTCAAFPRT